MNNYLSKFFILFLLLLFFVPCISFAQSNDKMFKAEVIEIIEEDGAQLEDGSATIQQKIKLKGLEGEWKDKEIIFDETEYSVISSVEYEEGDKVFVNYFKDIDEKDVFHIVGFVRYGMLFLLALIFALLVILVGRAKGLRALLVLTFTFFVILKFIIPQILNGHSPLLIAIIGSIFILFVSIYFTEGLKRTSTIAIFSIIISLLATGLLSFFFVSLTKLTGFASEEAVYLVNFAGGSINIKGLLLAGILIGALGVLDDVVISQVMLIKQLKQANPNLSQKEIYKRSMKVGISHLSSMVNTLFLAYTGAALPLLILFSIDQPPFLSFIDVINNEIIATEIVRTLTGSIGLVLAVPLSSLMAVYFIKVKKG